MPNDLTRTRVNPFETDLDRTPANHQPLTPLGFIARTTMIHPDRPAVIHGVQHVFHAPAWLDRWPSNNRSSRIVFITRRIPQRWVEVLLEAIGEEVADVPAVW